MSIQAIAQAEGLSTEYVAKLMRILRRGGLVKSTRGASGGYHLDRPPADMTLWQAIAVLGGPLFPESFCDSHPGSLSDCVHAPSCSIRGVWRSLNDLLRVALEGLTVEDLTRGETLTSEFLRRDWQRARGDDSTRKPAAKRSTATRTLETGARGAEAQKA